MSYYGDKLNPEISLRTARGIKGMTQKIIVTHNPSETDQNQLLFVSFLNIGSDDVIVPGMANLSFNINIDYTNDKNRMLVSNIGRAIVKLLAVEFEGNEILSINDFNIFACYKDFCKTKSGKRNAVRKGIISNDAKDKNASNARDNAIVNAYWTSSLSSSTIKC